jgi:2,5-dioxopentanoate dehydrogenase
MNLHGQSFLGDRLGARAGATFQATSPLDRAPLPPPFFLANEQDVSAALELAESAFAQFRTTTGEQRAGFLERIADEIAALGEALIARAHQETGLPEARLTGERTRTINQLKLFAQVAREGSWGDARIDHAIPNRQPVPKPDLRRMFIPIGPVVVFGSSNFPLAFSVAGGDTASALATGNPVVVKAHSGHPGTSELAATAIRKAVSGCNLPSAFFQCSKAVARSPVWHW